MPRWSDHRPDPVKLTNFVTGATRSRVRANLPMKTMFPSDGWRFVAGFALGGAWLFAAQLAGWIG